MASLRGIGGSEPLRSESIAGRAGGQEYRRPARTSRLGNGTLACPRCDAPVTLATARVTLVDELHCPFCRHAATVRDFLSLRTPTRPTRVEVHVVHPARPAAR